jgi:lysophospholipase L1-like esterase
VTVLNLGRTSSFALDTWYYLVGTARYRPDVVVFYLGMNDRYDLDREACLPATHPTLHGAWRWMVERSRLLWLTRVYLPRLAGGPGSGADVTGSEREQPLRCDPDRAFQAWTDVLVETATRHGARVVVATPVFSCLAPLDRDFAGAHRGVAPGEALASADGPYRRALACLLAAGCDLGAVDLGPDGLGGLVEAGLRVVAAAASPALVKPPDELRGAAWKRSAAAFGATLVDFAAALRAISPGHRLGPPHLVDSVHLSPTAYGLLARQVARAILDGQRSGPGAATGPVASLPDGAGEPVLAVQDPTEVALTYARARQFLTAAILAGQPAAAANPRARLLLGWLRRGLGGPSGLDAADEAGLEDFAAGAGLVRGAASPAR